MCLDMRLISSREDWNQLNIQPTELVRQWNTLFETLVGVLCFTLDVNLPKNLFNIYKQTR